MLLIISAVALILLGVGGAVAVVDGSAVGGATTGTTSSSPSSRPEIPNAVPDVVREAYGIFRRARSSRDEVSAQMEQKLALPGVNGALARLVVDGSSLQAQRYVAPGPDGTMCVVDGTASGSCMPADVFATDGTVSADECPSGLPGDQIVVSGIVPDAVKEVELVSPSGAVQVAVKGNAWSYTGSRAASGRIQHVIWTSGDKQHERDVPYSPDVNRPCTS